MRLIALIGILLLLILPLSYVSTTTEVLGVESTFTFTVGFFWTSTGGDVLKEETNTFEPDWVTEEGNVYEGYFGDGLNLAGAAILALLILGLVFAVLDTDSKKSAYILLICGIALLVLRALALNDAEIGFYDTQKVFGVTATYLEIPIGFIVSLIFGIIDSRKG